jgi:hypothetical protein
LWLANLIVVTKEFNGIKMRDGNDASFFFLYFLIIIIIIFINCDWVVARWQYTFTRRQYTGNTITINLTVGFQINVHDKW